MAQWYYYDESGDKIGPFTPTALKKMALKGKISPEATVENDEGRSAFAKNVKGLEFPQEVSRDTLVVPDYEAYMALVLPMPRIFGDVQSGEVEMYEKTKREVIAPLMLSGKYANEKEAHRIWSAPGGIYYHHRKYDFSASNVPYFVEHRIKAMYMDYWLPPVPRKVPGYGTYMKTVTHENRTIYAIQPGEDAMYERMQYDVIAPLMATSMFNDVLNAYIAWTGKDQYGTRSNTLGIEMYKDYWKPSVPKNIPHYDTYMASIRPLNLTIRKILPYEIEEYERMQRDVVQPLAVAGLGYEDWFPYERHSELEMPLGCMVDPNPLWSAMRRDYWLPLDCKHIW